MAPQKGRPSIDAHEPIAAISTRYHANNGCRNAGRQHLQRTRRFPRFCRISSSTAQYDIAPAWSVACDAADDCTSSRPNLPARVAIQLEICVPDFSHKRCWRPQEIFWFCKLQAHPGLSFTGDKT